MKFDNTKTFIDFSTDDYYLSESNNNIDLTTYLNIINKEENIKSNINVDQITIDYMVKQIVNKNVDHVKELLELDKEQNKIINMIDNDGESLLHISIFFGSYELTRLFLKYGAGPNKRNDDGQTPVFRIIFSSNEKLIGLLLEYGAILNIQDNDGNTPLHFAVLSKNYAIIKSLLEYGVDPLVHNKNDLVSFDFAVSKVDNTIVYDKKVMDIFSEYIE